MVNILCALEVHLPSSAIFSICQELDVSKGRAVKSRVRARFVAPLGFGLPTQPPGAKPFKLSRLRIVGFIIICIPQTLESSLNIRSLKAE